MRTTKSAVAGLLVGAMAVAGPATLPGSFAGPAAADVVVGDTPGTLLAGGRPRVRGQGRRRHRLRGRGLRQRDRSRRSARGGRTPEPCGLRRRHRGSGQGSAGRRRRPRPGAGCAEGLSLRRRQLRRGRGKASVETREGEPRHRSCERRVRPPPQPRGPGRRGQATPVYAGGASPGSAIATVGTSSSWARPRGRSTVASSPTRTSPCGPWSRNPSSRTLYVAGRFSAVNGARRLGVAAVHSGSGRTRSVVFTDAARDVRAGRERRRLPALHRGGHPRDAAAAWRTTTGARVWRQRAKGDIQAIDFQRRSVYFGPARDSLTSRSRRSSRPVRGRATWTRTSPRLRQVPGGAGHRRHRRRGRRGRTVHDRVGSARRGVRAPRAPRTTRPVLHRATPPSRGRRSRLVLLRQVHQGEHVGGGPGPAWCATPGPSTPHSWRSRGTSRQTSVCTTASGPVRRSGRTAGPRRRRGAARVRPGPEAPRGCDDRHRPPGSAARSRWRVARARDPVAPRRAPGRAPSRRCRRRSPAGPRSGRGGPQPRGGPEAPRAGTTPTGEGAMIRSTTWRSPRWSGDAQVDPGLGETGALGAVARSWPSRPRRTATG